MRRIIYSIFILATAFALLSHSSGAGAVQRLDRTGSPIGTGSCASCHTGGNFGTEVVATLLQDDVEVSSYVPGEEYILRIEINTSNAPSRYGFQAVALATGDNITAGSYGTLPEGTRSIDVNDRTYVEHATKLSEGTINIPWVAPDAGTGEVRFYAAGNAVNNAAGSAGDDPDILDQALRIAEGAVSSTNALAQLRIQWMLYPNPSNGVINAKIEMDRSQQYQLRLIDQQNRLLGSRSVRLNTGENRLNWQMDNLPSGLYFLQLVNERGVSTRKFIHQAF